MNQFGISYRKFCHVIVYTSLEIERVHSVHCVFDVMMYKECWLSEVIAYMKLSHSVSHSFSQ